MFNRSLLAVFLCVYGISAVQAEQYFQSNYGDTSIATGVTNLVDARLDKTDTGYYFALGAQVFDNVDFELALMDFGSAKLVGETGDTFTVGGTDYVFDSNGTIKQTNTSLGFVTKPKFSINEYINLFGKVGFHAWSKETNISLATSEKDIKDDGVDLLYGLGADYTLYGNTALSAGYDVIEFGSNNVEFVYLGARFGFGAPPVAEE